MSSASRSCCQRRRRVPTPPVSAGTRGPLGERRAHPCGSLVIVVDRLHSLRESASPRLTRPRACQGWVANTTCGGPWTPVARAVGSVDVAARGRSTPTGGARAFVTLGDAGTCWSDTGDRTPTTGARTSSDAGDYAGILGRRVRTALRYHAGFWWVERDSNP
jgi:hypothetical protein